eukprot:4975142-Pleurochrysis_carterae.AAC.2
MSPSTGNWRTSRCGCNGELLTATLYYWEGMLTHCEQMCQHCEVCRNRDTPSSGKAVSTQVMKDAPFPFHTVSIDHKTVTTPKGTR